MLVVPATPDVFVYLFPPPPSHLKQKNTNFGWPCPLRVLEDGLFLILGVCLSDWDFPVVPTVTIKLLQSDSVTASPLEGQEMIETIQF